MQHETGVRRSTLAASKRAGLNLADADWLVGLGFDVSASAAHEPTLIARRVSESLFPSRQKIIPSRTNVNARRIGKHSNSCSWFGCQHTHTSLAL